MSESTGWMRLGAIMVVTVWLLSTAAIVALALLVSRWLA